jgi:hypothetical protein
MWLVVKKQPVRLTARIVLKGETMCQAAIFGGTPTW